jgi:predicted PurR-regulated permease PerM
MLGIDGKAARAAWTVFLVALTLFLVYWIRETLVLFTIALFFAYMITPLVDVVYRYTPQRLSRAASIAIVYVVLVGLLGTVGSWIGSRIAEEATTLVGRWPELLEKSEQVMSRPVPEWLEPVRARALEMLRSQVSGGDRIVSLMKTGGQTILSGIGNLVYIILIPLLGFYFVKDGRQFKLTLLSQFTDLSRRRFFAGILADIHLLLAQYMRALLILSLFTFVFYSIFFVSVGLPYALLLAGIASVLEFVPFIGPVIGMAAAITVGSLSGFAHPFWIVIFVLAYQTFQNYVIQPLVMSSGVEVHPLLVLFGVMAGEQIGGLAGVFFSIPVIATLRIIWDRVKKAMEDRELNGTALPGDGENTLGSRERINAPPAPV